MSMCLKKTPSSAGIFNLVLQASWFYPIAIEVRLKRAFPSLRKWTIVARDWAFGLSIDPGKEPARFPLHQHVCLLDFAEGFFASRTAAILKVNG